MIRISNTEGKSNWAELGAPTEEGDYTVSGFDGPVFISDLNIEQAKTLMVEHKVSGDKIQVSLSRWDEPYIYWNIVPGVMWVE